MPTNQTSTVIQHVRRAVLLHDGAGLTDGHLLGCYIERRDEAAFAALVKRHGPMVWGVCRRLLNHHDAEDAFQATFLVLVRKAASVVPREMVANWLYGVAHQTALQARRAAGRRGTRERQVTEMPDADTGDAVPHDLWADLKPILDQELSRLPDTYRAVIVQCDLECKTRKEVARQLGWPEGTVAGRLARARVMLAKRLGKRGVVLSGGALAALLTQNVASAVPTAVASSTITAAGVFAAGRAAADGAVSVQVAALTEGVLNTMFLSKLKVVLVLLVFAAASGAAGLVFRAQAAEPPQAPRATGGDDKAEPPAAAKGQKARSDKERLQGAWKLVAMVEDGKELKDEEEMVGTWKFKDAGAMFEAESKDKKKKLKAFFRFRLDETANPRLVDVVEAKGPEDLLDTAEWEKRFDDASERGEGVFSVSGDTLKICLGRKPGERPTSLECKEGSDSVLFVLQREKPKRENETGGKR